jgi:hypothetical protein
MKANQIEESLETRSFYKSVGIREDANCSEVQKLKPRARFLWKLLGARAVLRCLASHAESDYRASTYTHSRAERVIARRLNYLEGVRGELAVAQHRYERAKQKLGGWDQ